MKTIGVIGGLGPQATMDFEARVHKVSQSLIPPRYNSGYPPMIVYYHRYPPFVIDDKARPIRPLQPEPHLLDNLLALAPLVDFFVITSNAPHLMQDLIEKTTGRPILSMIDATLAEVQRRGWQRIGVLGLGDPVVYTSRLQPLDLPTETLAPDHLPLRDQLDQSILALMTGQSGPAETAIALEAVNTLRAKSVDGIILGCTEIPLLLNDSSNAPDLINPLQLLAEAAVKHAIA
jgi:aspartate racemase